MTSSEARRHLFLLPCGITRAMFILPGEGHGASDGKKSGCNAGRPRFSPWVGNISWRREWHLTPVFWPGEFHRQKSLVGYNPWDRKESSMTDRLILTNSGSNVILGLEVCRYYAKRDYRSWLVFLVETEKRVWEWILSVLDPVG